MSRRRRRTGRAYPTGGGQRDSHGGQYRIRDTHDHHEIGQLAPGPPSSPGNVPLAEAGANGDGRFQPEKLCFELHVKAARSRLTHPLLEDIGRVYPSRAPPRSERDPFGKAKGRFWPTSGGLSARLAAGKRPPSFSSRCRKAGKACNSPFGKSDNIRNPRYAAAHARPPADLHYGLFAGHPFLRMPKISGHRVGNYPCESIRGVSLIILEFGVC